MKISSEIAAILCVPGNPSRQLFEKNNRMFDHDNPEGTSFPIIEGTPVLLNEANSVFRIKQFENGEITTMELTQNYSDTLSSTSRFRKYIRELVPKRTRNISDFSPEMALEDITHSTPTARILIVGAGDFRFEAKSSATIVYTDVALSPDTHIICDAHDIPFVNESFDAVIAVAVLEHVADPFRCVAEFRRVLKPKGRVYAATPFMQQVHMGRYDFTRFTALGHRRLFQWFDEIRAGVSNGPGTAVAWSLEYFMTSFFESKLMRNLVSSAVRFLSCFFLIFDGILARKPGSYDCASAYYFYGELRVTPITDYEIVKQYRGLN